MKIKFTGEFELSRAAVCSFLDIHRDLRDVYEPTEEEWKRCAQEYIVGNAVIWETEKIETIPENEQWEIEVGDGYVEARCPGCHKTLREDEYTGLPKFSKHCPECGLALQVPDNIPTFREVYGQSEEKEDG